MDSLLHRLRMEVAYTEHFLHRVRQTPSPDRRIRRVPETENHLLQLWFKIQILMPTILTTVAVRSTGQQAIVPVKVFEPRQIAFLQHQVLMVVSGFIKETDVAARC